MKMLLYGVGSTVMGYLTYDYVAKHNTPPPQANPVQYISSPFEAVKAKENELKGILNRRNSINRIGRLASSWKCRDCGDVVLKSGDIQPSNKCWICGKLNFELLPLETWEMKRADDKRITELNQEIKSILEN
jgi:rubrerythrin